MLVPRQRNAECLAASSLARERVAAGLAGGATSIHVRALSKVASGQPDPFLILKILGVSEMSGGQDNMELVEVDATVGGPLVEVHFHTSAFDRYSFLQESSEAGDADVESNEENLEEVFEGPGTSKTPARTGRKVDLGSKTAGAELRSLFADTQYPSSDAKRELAKKFGVTLLQVSNWFRNRRRSKKVSSWLTGSFVLERVRRAQWL